MDWYLQIPYDLIIRFEECPVNACSCRCGSLDAALTLDNDVNVDDDDVLKGALVEKQLPRLINGGLKLY